MSLWNLTFSISECLEWFHAFSVQGLSSGTAVRVNIFANQNWTLKTSHAPEIEEHPSMKCWFSKLVFCDLGTAEERTGTDFTSEGSTLLPESWDLLYSSFSSLPLYTTFPAFRTHKTSFSHLVVFSHTYSWFIGRPRFSQCTESQVWHFFPLCLI